MANHGPSYGLDADLALKRQAAYDPAREAEARAFIESTSGKSIGPSFQNGLKDGLILCAMMNALKPGSCKTSNGKMPFVQMENINSYVAACKAYGLSESDLFLTVELYEAKNMNAVVSNVLAVKRQAGKRGGAGGSSGGSAGARSPAPASGGKFCSSCGQAAVGVKFCSNCGTPV